MRRLQHSQALNDSNDLVRRDNWNPFEPFFLATLTGTLPGRFCEDASVPGQDRVCEKWVTPP
jgi:hypothetical protein